MDQKELQDALDLVKETAKKHPKANIVYRDHQVIATFVYLLPGYDEFDF